MTIAKMVPWSIQRSSEGTHRYADMTPSSFACLKHDFFCRAFNRTYCEPTGRDAAEPKNVKNLFAMFELFSINTADEPVVTEQE